ncbi:CYTH domain-containing protein [Lachnospiraceae bacterium RM5]|nr:CYTH domain-containing protein [Lachnospiraceae bacterium RM5]
MEIERKFLIKKLPDLTSYDYLIIEQGYLNTDPVIRVRKQNNKYVLTYKTSGLLSREEYNLNLNKESYDHLIKKSDGNIITKYRYLIPYEGHMIELDIFKNTFEGLIIAEVEFDSIAEADSFTPPDWFGEDVTYLTKYHNSTMSKMNVEEIREIT